MRTKLSLKLLLPLLLGVLSAQGIARGASPGSTLTVTYLNCGQGDATVIQTPSGKTYLVDAGPNDKMFGGHFDAGSDVIIPFLKSHNIKKIEGLVISHSHLDHYGGALSLMDRFPVDLVMDSGLPSVSPVYLDMLKMADRRKIKYRVIREKEKLDWDKDLEVVVLAPRAKIDLKNPAKANINDCSVVIKMTYKNTAFLFPGDIESETENYLVKNYGEKLRAQILKVAHHGSDTSTTDGFLAAVRPETAIILCGKKNRYRHPHKAVLKRLEEKGIKYYRTDKEGSVEIISDGSQYRVRKFFSD